MEGVVELRLSTGVPCLRWGTGPPLLVASGLTAEHKSPRGVWRRMAVSWAAPFAEHFTVHLVNRRPGLPPGTSMADLAADYAGAIEEDVGEPVLLHGTSTGGSVALQLAVDRPELVRRLVVSAAACTLSPAGRQLQADVLRLTEAGQPRQASARLIGAVAPRGLARPASAVGWMAGNLMTADDPTDMLRTIAAEDTFDVESRLGRVTAPTLVIGGGADPWYTEDLFRRTAAGIPDGRVVFLPGKSHQHVAGSKVTAGLALGFLLG